MHSLKTASTKHNLINGLALGVMALAFAFAWAGPNVAGGAKAQEQPQPQQQQQQDQAQSTTFTGTVVKEGDNYVLRDSSGAMYKLDDASRAKPFEGKPVKVTGQLDEQANVIHVESIEGTAA